MNDAGTGSGFDVVGQQNRRETVVERIEGCQRVLETDALEGFAFGFGDNFSFHAVALEGFFIEAFGKNEAAVRSFNENVLQIRMHVQSLVGRNGPRCRCPNNDGGRFFQLDAEDVFELAPVFIGNRESNV
ncbi:unknown [Parasutterella excrementihominis CAG:233]|nr:unknown [Parasutterella excrementihominis CAG:233]